MATLLEPFAYEYMVNAMWVRPWSGGSAPSSPPI